jgi:aryl sulfotransferase
MSFYNHCSAMTPQALERIDSLTPDMGRSVPRCPPDPRAFWRQWLTTGVRDGETDGHPFLSFFDFEATYWRARRAENLLLVHFNDLKADLDGEMRRIAAFLGIEPRPGSWPGLVEAATFRSMKDQGRGLLGDEVEASFEGGADRFFYKGTNGRWRDVMTADDLALYESTASRLTPGLANWLEGGRLRAGDPTSSAD